MQREFMIDLLVLDCLERAATGRRGIWLLSILRDGFCGFGNMSDAQLADEFARSGLKVREAATEHDDREDLDGIDEWPLLPAGTHNPLEASEY